MGMSLDRWNIEMRPSLDEIRWHAHRIMQHVDALPVQADFETLAEGDMKLCEQALTQALGRVSRALKTYREKPRDTGTGA
ncbi:hypothetical protein [Bradyrhizobium sp. 1(2017)]|uniref:hypothetical protein n=1 Tax=Bradyrhizobium sp. 1(2017) TaxID=1404888 RepID=UPI00140F3995|nr:hypothetical protein [Bradyrhizobium sp. 1(2017)]QIO34355.1 hypothetical protein HAP40_22425 [Bradyrhizobium sp. 1(2017)]